MLITAYAIYKGPHYFVPAVKIEQAGCVKTVSWDTNSSSTAEAAVAFAQLKATRTEKRLGINKGRPLTVNTVEMDLIGLTARR